MSSGESESTPSTTVIIPTSYPETTAVIIEIPQPNSTISPETFELLDQKCGPNGTATNHTDCQSNRQGIQN